MIHSHMSVTYLDHFGLRQAPFDMTPNPALLHSSPAHDRLLAWIEEGVAARLPMLSLTGEVGTGKTTLLRVLRSRHRRDWVIGLIWPFYSRGEDIRVQARRAFGLQDRGSERPGVSSRRIGRFAESMRARDRFAVLMVDEAQALGIDSISALASLTTNGADGSALTVLLIGRPELRDLLAAPELRDLPLGEGACAVLAPLAEDDTADYVAHRLARAGAQGPIFDQSALRVLHEFSGGVPRLINIMADHCLDRAAAERLSQLDAAWVRAVLHEATTAGVLSQPGRAGDDSPQPAAQDAPAMPLRLIPDEPQVASPSGTAGRAEDAALPLRPAPEVALAAAGAEARPPLAEMRKQPVARAEPVGRNPPAPRPEASRAAPERRPAPDAAAARTRAPDNPPGAAARRDDGRRRRLAWVAALLAVAVTGGAAFLWLQRDAAPAPVAAVTSTPASGAALQQAAAPAPRQPVRPPAPAVVQTAAQVPPPVAITPEPTIAALMQQALESEARDPAAAAVTYARAAIRGRSRAAWYLGQFYETGTGVEQSLGSARMWYAAAPDLPASRRRLQTLPAAGASAGIPATPVPTFQARLSNGASEMIWRVPDGVTPARFRVEALDPAGETLRPQETTVPGLILPTSVSAWRVTAIGADGRESAPSAMVRMIPAEE